MSSTFAGITPQMFLNKCFISFDVKQVGMIYPESWSQMSVCLMSADANPNTDAA